MRVARRPEHLIGDRNGLVGAAGQHQQVHVQPGGRLPHRIAGVADWQPGHGGERAGDIAVQLRERGGNQLGHDAQHEVLARARQLRHPRGDPREVAVGGAGVRDYAGQRQCGDLPGLVSGGGERGGGPGQQRFDRRVVDGHGVGDCRLQQEKFRGFAITWRGRGQEGSRPLDGQRGNRLPDQLTRAGPDRVRIAEAARDARQPQCVVAGLEGAAHGREQLSDPGGGIKAFRRVRPQVVGAHRAIAGDRQQRNLRGQPLHVDGLVADRRDRLRVGRADQRQREKGACFGRRQAADDLLPEELVR
jgi:hypothetical protein